MKVCSLRICSILAMLMVIIVLSGCGGTQARGADARRAQVVRMFEPETNLVVKGASEWAHEHPDIYQSFRSNRNNDENYDYVAAYPYLQTLYEGIAFSFSYNSARGHHWTVEDSEGTGRVKHGGCFQCKSSNFHGLLNTQGVEYDAYAMSFDEALPLMTETVSCFTCHGNTPGVLIHTNRMVYDALGREIYDMDPKNLACAQCHNEYFWYPGTRIATLPYNSRAGMHPTAMLEFFNGMFFDGQVFADYVNPRSGVRQIKIQHPEIETLLSEGNVHGTHANDAMRFSCSDCHMGSEVNASGVSFINHFLSSPLNNPRLVEQNCSSCHGDMAALTKTVRDIQAAVNGRKHPMGFALAELMEELVTAVQSGRFTNDQLDPVRMAYRNAQFYFDYVWVENSDGAHNSRLTHYTLDRAEEWMEQTKTLLGQL